MAKQITMIAVILLAFTFSSMAFAGATRSPGIIEYRAGNNITEKNQTTERIILAGGGLRAIGSSEGHIFYGEIYRTEMRAEEMSPEEKAINLPKFEIDTMEELAEGRVVDIDMFKTKESTSETLTEEQAQDLRDFEIEVAKEGVVSVGGKIVSIALVGAGMVVAAKVLTAGLVVVSVANKLGGGTMIEAPEASDPNFGATQ